MGTRSFTLGAVVATGAVLLIPGVAAAVARASRPLVRSAVKNGSSVFDEVKKAGAEAYEHFEDVVAEVRADIDDADDRAAAAPDGSHDPAAGRE